MKKALAAKGVQHVKINHVVFIKATEDDELVSRESLKEMTLDLSRDGEKKTRKQFMDMVMESVLAEEFEKTMTIDNLLKDPQALSQKMIEADQASVEQSEAEDRRPGPVLMHQLELIDQKIADNSSDVNLEMATELVTAVFEMRNELLEGMQAQKGDDCDCDYSDETQIIDKINEVTDKVVVQLAKKHHMEEASTSALGQFLGQWIPEEELDEAVSRVRADLVAQPIAVEKVLENPADVSKQIIDADIAAFQGADENKRNPGSIIMRQLDLVKQDLVEKALKAGDANLSEVAAAAVELKEELLAGIQIQKAQGTIYASEAQIVDKVTDLTDDVILELVKEEYQAGQLSPSRLAQILRRLIPETSELKRLLPKIKTVLLQAGMSLQDYLEIIKTLGKELQSDELAKIFEESAEEIGIDADTIIQEIKNNPNQAAELIFLASEIQKGVGDEKIMTDLMVDYVERLGASLDDEVGEGDAKGKQHLRHVMSSIESDIVGRLKDMNAKDDLIERLEEKFESRMAEFFEKAKAEWLKDKSDKKDQKDPSKLSLFKMIEQNIVDNEALNGILDPIRSEVESGTIDENNFEQIYLKMKEEEKRQQIQEEQRVLPQGVLRKQTFELIIKKEVSLAKRYGVHLSALAFALIKATPKNEDVAQSLPHQILVDAILKKMVKIVRSSDLVSEFGKNEIAVILPLTPTEEARRALNRCLQLLYLEPIEAQGTNFTIKMAGVTTSFSTTKTPDATAFINELSNELMQMEVRIRNIQNLLK